MSELTSASAPALRDDDHVRGPEGAPLVIVYADFACPHCAVAHVRLKDAQLRVALRHFALKARHPRAVQLALAAEAAAAQDAFWPFADAVYADQGHVDDPHLWDKAAAMGLDVDRFDADRRSASAADRVARDVREGLRAGVAQTPTLIVEGALHGGVPTGEWLQTLH
ncbi:MAG: thioredoxin domain-containing protein [Solirubrobacteraceae bacterium]|nr:thioredoxin domain-containing protein [Solirubrobacteraceae bacterium]